MTPSIKLLHLSARNVEMKLLWFPNTASIFNVKHAYCFFSFPAQTKLEPIWSEGNTSSSFFLSLKRKALEWLWGKCDLVGKCAYLLHSHMCAVHIFHVLFGANIKPSHNKFELLEFSNISTLTNARTYYSMKSDILYACVAKVNRIWICWTYVISLQLALNTEQNWIRLPHIKSISKK